MKWKSKKRARNGAIHRTRTQASTKEQQDKTTSQAMESRHSQIQSRHFH
jgi:hypothetical protein